MKPINQIPFNMPQVKGGFNERGELLEYFAGKIQKPIGFVAYKLTGMDLPTLHFIKSQCDQEEKRGEPWGKTFYTSLKPALNKKEQV